jgi:hypothetical protein
MTLEVDPESERGVGICGTRLLSRDVANGDESNEELASLSLQLKLEVDLNGHEAGNGGYSQRKPTTHRDSSTRKLVLAWLHQQSISESSGPITSAVRCLLVSRSG